MAIYFFDKNQNLIKIVPNSSTIEAIQTQELDEDSLLKDTLSVKVKGDENLLNAEYIAVKSYTGNAQTFDMYRIVTDTTPDKTMSFTGMSLAPYELNGHILQDLRPVNHTLEYTLGRVLNDTDWRLGYIDDGLNNVTTNFYYVSVKEALKELQSLAGCEFVFKVEISGQKITDKWVEVYREMGNRTKKRFNYGTNALTVVRETNKTDIYTALIGRGKGEEVSSAEDNDNGQAGHGRKITFVDIEWSTANGNPLNKPKGQYYLEMPQATLEYGMRNVDGTLSPRIGIVEFDDEEDPANLLRLTYEQLKVSARPKVLFKSTVANIGATGIGDTVTIHRHDLNMHYETRVRKVVRNKLNDNKTQIELGDAVVTPSTKIAKQNNATIKNLKQELDRAQQEITETRLSADGKTNNHYGQTEPERKRTGDTWYRPHPSIAGEYQVLTWDGNDWELILDTSDTSKVERELEEVIKPQIENMTISITEADNKANNALEKVGVNTNLISEHKKTLDEITTITLPDINNSVSDTLKKANDAMEEAQRVDGKIADYVTRNGLVSGTTVDTKINDATGEINKKITTVESKIPTELGGRNYYTRETKLSILETVSSLTKAYDINGFKATGGSSGNKRFRMHDVIKSNGDWTISGYFRGTQNVVVSFNVNLNDLVTSEWFTSTTDNTWKYFEFSGNVTNQSTIYNFINFRLGAWAHYEFKDIKVEKGSIPTDWTPAPEDNYTQEEFAIFESTYNEDVKGIKSSLTELSNNKLDGSTYTTFYENEYKKTAQGVTDAWTAVNKIVDENGNSTDSFAKAVYDRNAQRQTADFQNVTKDLVTTATYEVGIDGVTKSISSISEDLKNKVTQTQVNEAILADKTVKDTRTTNQLPSWYQTYYPRQEVKEFKTNNIIGIEEAGFSLVTTEIPWTGSSGGTIKQTARTNNDMYIRRGYADQTQWTAWEKVADTTYVNTKITEEAGLIRTELSEYTKKVDLDGYATTEKVNTLEQTVNGNSSLISTVKKTADGAVQSTSTEYQIIKERSDLYSRTIGSTDEEINSKIARMVMTDSIFQTEISTAKSSGLNLIDRTTEAQGYMSGVTGNGVLTGDLAERSRYVRINNIQGGQTYTLAKQSGMASDANQFRLSWRGSDGYTVVSSLSVQGDISTVTAPTNAKELVISYPRDSEVKMEIGSTFTGFALTPDLASQITQTANSWAVQLKDGNDLKAEINASTDGLRFAGHLIYLDGDTYMHNAFAEKIKAIEISADKITTGILDASKVNVVNLDANNITANKTEFIKTNWNEATGGGVTITGGGVRAINSEGSRVTLENGVVSVGNRAGVNLGFFGDHVLNKDATGTMTITASLGTETAFISATSADGKTYKRSMSIMSGAGEIDMFTTLDLNKNSLKDVNDIGFTGGHIKGNIDGSYRYLTIDAGTGTSFDISGTTRMSITSVVNIFSGIDMKGKDIASVGKITYNSDQRLKTNIKDTNIRALDAIRNWQLVSYDWLESGEHVEIGLIAQNSPEVMIYNEESDIYGIDAGKQAMINTLAIQQLDSKTDDEISRLKAQIASLQDELAQLKGD